jgi:phage FluMu protein Com
MGTKIVHVQEDQCPHCKSFDIDWGINKTDNYDPTKLYQTGECNHCQKTFTEVYDVVYKHTEIDE